MKNFIIGFLVSNVIGATIMLSQKEDELNEAKERYIELAKFNDNLLTDLHKLASDVSKLEYQSKRKK